MGIDRTRLKLNEFNRKRKRLGEDLCDVKGYPLQDGGTVGDTLGGPVALASNVPCFYESTGQNSNVVIGGTAYLASHRLQMERTSATGAIKPSDTITVYARNGNAVLIFEEPRLIKESFSPLVTIMATLTDQGHNQ
jgi:hypothetical protein